MSTFCVCSFALVIILVIRGVIKVRASIIAVGGAPGLRVPCCPISLWGSLLPTCSWNPGLQWQYAWRNQVYERFGRETISIIPYLYGRPMIYTRSYDVARMVLSTTEPFAKGDDSTQGVVDFGNNLFTSNGSEWRRHRRIMAPAFTSQTYQLVWEETAATYREMSNVEGWDRKQSIIIPSFNALTIRFALVVLSRCGFGNCLPWKSEAHTKDVMRSFGDALELVSQTIILRLIIPSWMYWLPIARLQKIDAAFLSLERQIKHLIKERRGNTLSQDRHDILSLMVQACEDDKEGGLTMSDQEITGNTFFILFAGHETMSSIWNATIALLALHPDIQDEIHEEITRVMKETGRGAELQYSDFQRLNKVLACFLEAGRMYPAGFVLMRDTTDDVVLPCGDLNGLLPVRKGTRVAIDMVGLHHNAKYYPEPEIYRPSRWYNAKENEMSLFSLGSRACIGRKFALTEACCFLSHLLHERQIRPSLESGQTKESWASRVLSTKTTMTLGVNTVPVELIRR